MCQQNPNRRCQTGNNFASKQLEKQSLTTACGSSVRVSLKHLEAAWKGSGQEPSSCSSQSTLPDPEGLCLEVSHQALLTLQQKLLEAQHLLMLGSCQLANTPAHLQHHICRVYIWTTYPAIRPHAW